MIFFFLNTQLKDFFIVLERPLYLLSCAEGEQYLVQCLWYKYLAIIYDFLHFEGVFELNFYYCKKTLEE